MREGGKKLAQIMNELEKKSAIGISTKELDDLAEKMILQIGGKPSFKGYGETGASFPATICASLNDEIVHGIPSADRILQNGDVFKIDIGMKYRGFHTDMARTFLIGDGKNKEGIKIIETVKKSFYKGVAKLKPGKRLNDYSKAVEKFVRKRGFSVVENLVGHGIGEELHEYPQIPNFGRSKECEFELRPGMTFALEPMINAGTHRTILADDEWTFKTADGKLSAHWENTILITDKGVEILTETER